MANWNYTHGGATNLDRLRFAVGDHRGANGAFTGTNQVFSDEELNDLLSAGMFAGDVPSAARAAMQNRICREALSAGVAGTTDTSDRPKTLVIALDALARYGFPGSLLPAGKFTTNASMDAAGLSDMGD